MIDQLISLYVLIIMRTRQAAWIIEKELVLENFSLEEDWFLG